MVVADIIYENPDGREYGEDLRGGTLQDFERASTQIPVTEAAVKAQYIMGLVYTKGYERWGVERDLDQGLTLLQSAWKNGAADAGYTLAHIYLQGLGVTRDSELALEYLRESSNMGFLLSLRELGRAYIGEEEDWEDQVGQDVSCGLALLERAANSGDLKSAMSLASIYAKGELVEKDFVAAREWTYKWAESQYGTDPNAFSWLARFYEQGLGVGRDLVQAYKFYDLMDPAGADGKARLAEEMTDEQIAEAIRQSRAWQEEHNTFVPSYYNLEYQEDGSFR